MKGDYEHDPQQPAGLSCFAFLSELVSGLSFVAGCSFSTAFELSSLLLKIFLIENVIAKS